MGVPVEALWSKDQINEAQRLDEIDEAQRLFLAEVDKAGGPLDRVGDFIETCNKDEINNFVEGIKPGLVKLLMTFWKDSTEATAQDRADHPDC